MDAWLGIIIAGIIVGGVIALPVIAHLSPRGRLARAFRGVGQWGNELYLAAPHPEVPAPEYSIPGDPPNDDPPAIQ